MAASMGLPFFVRDKDGVKVMQIDASQDEPQIEDYPTASLPKAKVSAWSPDGTLLAMGDPTIGVSVFDMNDLSQEVKTIPDSTKNCIALTWSPLATTLITLAQVPKGSTEQNLHVWRKSNEGCDSGTGGGGGAPGGGGEYVLSTSFSHPKLEKDKKVFQWTEDEELCARLLPGGTVNLHDGADLAGTPVATLEFPKPATDFEFAPGRFRAPLKARLAVYVGDVRDDMQRVVGPGELSIWDIGSRQEGGSGALTMGISTSKAVSHAVSAGQSADLKWSPTGTALVAHCQTEVDETGKSYYGGSKLWLVSADGTYSKDLTEVDETTSNGTSVQAVGWSPTRDEFILIRGFQPAQATLWTWDSKARKASMVRVLLEKAHRNTIRFNHFGSMFCLAGFGNLAGDMDFFGRIDEDSYEKVSSATANCTVTAEWAPDGRHFQTAVLFPRMRVDNGFSIWKALTGQRITTYNETEEMYEAAWRPEAKDSLRFLDIAMEEVEKATKADATRTATAPQKAKQAYRPPKARGGGDGGANVAAMMRGEIAAPDNEHRRERRPWQPRPREGEEHKDPKESPTLRPSTPPADAEKSADLSTTASDSASFDTSGQQRTKSPAPQNSRPPPPAHRPPPPQEIPPSAPWAQEKGLVPREDAPASRQPGKSPGRQQKEQSQDLTPAVPPPATAPSQAPSAAPRQQAPGAYPPAPIQPPTQLSGADSAREQARQPQAQAGAMQAAQAAAQAAAQVAAGQRRGAGRGAVDPLAAYPTGAFPGARPQADYEALAQAGYAAGMFGGHPGFQGAYADPRLRAQAQQLHEIAARQQLQAAELATAYSQQQVAAAAAARAQQAQPPQQAQQQQRAAGGQDDKRQCPATGWQYVDPKGNVQGPFTLLEMQLWNNMGYFRPDLPMRCDLHDPWCEFAKLFPAPLEPFHSYPRRPNQQNNGQGR